jgi:hypothetical protein
LGYQMLGRPTPHLVPPGDLTETAGSSDPAVFRVHIGLLHDFACYCQHDAAKVYGIEMPLWASSQRRLFATQKIPDAANFDVLTHSRAGAGSAANRCPSISPFL